MHEIKSFLFIVFIKSLVSIKFINELKIIGYFLSKTNLDLFKISFWEKFFYVGTQQQTLNKNQSLDL